MSTLQPSNGPATRDRDAVAEAVAVARDSGARMVMVDGRSGSGKTELSAAIAERVPGVRTLHLEDAYQGWFGLAEGLEEVASGVLQALVQGRPGAYPSWDWTAGRVGRSAPVAPLQPGEILLVEGCGALADPVGAFADLGIWCEAPEQVRRDRAASRDSYDWSALWDAWSRQESALTCRRAPDLVFCT
nr:hypothetical protein [Actinomycetales bacterium]